MVAFVLLGSAAGFGCARVATQAGPPDAGGSRGIDATFLSDAILVTCGNGRQDPTESCDDGNMINGDGCNRLCQIEANYVCPTWGKPCQLNARCGDGVLSSNEQCDDGNAVGGDGCSATCGLEPGYQCHVPGKRCSPRCGDGVLTGSETCDDGNTTAGDGCSPTCQKEPGASCTGTPSVCVRPVCGNGIVEAGEACDAGKLNGLFYGDGKGCSKTCTAEPNCRDAAGHNMACATVCGNGSIEAGEQCDDGNLVDGDGCSKTCTDEAASGFTCTPMAKSDTVPCVQPANMIPGATCLELPVVYRDFKSEHEVGGHPDFFYLGNRDATGRVTRACVPNSGGPAKQNDSTARCWGIALPDLVNGKPQLNPLGTICPCQFTDFSSDTNLGHVPGYSEVLNGPLHTLETMIPNPLTYPGVGHPRWNGNVPIVTSAATFAQWFTDNTFNVRSVGTIELAPIPGGQYRFSSAVNAVSGGFFPVDPVPAPIAPGLLPTGEPLLCNLWPYWDPAAFPGCRGDQYLFPPSVDILTPGCALTMPPGCPGGTWVLNMQGFYHNSWFTDEVHYYFVFPPTGISLQFFGDDDMFIFINGKLVLDLGGVHQRLPGSVTVSADGIAHIVEGGSIDPVSQVITACPGIDPYTMVPTTMPADCRARTLDLGLAQGSTYEIAVFGADRHPTESNYQLTLNGFTTTQTVCSPFCGDGIVSGGEECDDGTAKNTGDYGGCTADCKFGPFCGDGIINGNEVCDPGRASAVAYSMTKSTGCTTGCTVPHYCGDGIVDTTYGEDCDQGDGVNGSTGAFCSASCRLNIQ